jgi:hypothetical protein
MTKQTYRVTIRNFAWVTYTVEAESKEEAEYIAMQKKNEGKEPPDKIGTNVQVEVEECIEEVLASNLGILQGIVK